MASLDSLPVDQRAVLELVLERGRSYDEIAKLLSVDRAGVRQRALAAFDAIGPQTQIPPERRALIADYLLGQLPPKVSDSVRDRLGSTPSERAWARMLASELSPIAREPLPEIPAAPAAAEAGTEPAPVTAVAERGDGADRGAPRSPLTPGSRRSSRRGGAIVLGLGGALLLAAVVVVLILVLASSSPKHTTSTAAAHRSGSSTTGTSTAAKVLATVSLLPQSGASKARGAAQVIKVGNTSGIVIVATGIPPNSKQDNYVVWLYNSHTDVYRLGFVNPGVGSNGHLQTTGPLPSNVSHFKQVLISLESQRDPKAPSKVVLQGALSLQ